MSLRMPPGYLRPQLFVPTTLFLLIFLVISCGSDRRDPSTAEIDTTPVTTDDNGEADSETETEVSICEMLARGELEDKSTVGCEFYPVNLPNEYAWYSDSGIPRVTFGVVAGNLSTMDPVNVTLLQADKEEGWKEVLRTRIPPFSMHTFKPYDQPRIEDSQAGLVEDFSFKLVSDRPIIAYQFNSIYNSATTDASTLIPFSSLSSNYHIIGSAHNYRDQYSEFPAFFAVAATKVDSKVTIRTTTAPATEDTPATIRDEVQVTLQPGDVYLVKTEVDGENLTGSTVTSDPEHPVAVFSGHVCNWFPKEAECCCDHLEDQLPGVDFWGTEFIAPHIPSRNYLTKDEPVFWQIYAAEDDTTVEIIAPEGFAGLPFTSKTLRKGELVQFTTLSNDNDPVDFHIRSVPLEVDGELVQKPIAVLQNLLSAMHTSTKARTGDPAMVYVSPIHQYLSRYVMLIPSGWTWDYVLVNKPKDATILLDGTAIDQSEFNDVNGVDYQVARLRVDDGVHTFESLEGAQFGVTALGWDAQDSYAYVGGMGMTRGPI